MRYTIREMVYIAIFGALWGAVEISLGSLLHVLSVPLNGAILAAIGIAILLVGRSVVPRRGSIFLMGLTAAVLKLFSLGGKVINPMLAILIEAALVEAALWWGTLSRGRCLWAGGLGASWNFFHPFLTQSLLAGWSIVHVYTWLIKEGAALLGLPSHFGWLVLGVLLSIKVALGVLGGLVGWQVAQQVARRLRWVRSDVSPPDEVS